MFACLVDAGRIGESGLHAGPPDRLRQGFGESAVASAKAEGGPHVPTVTVLLGVGQAFSPRVQTVGPDAVICDLHGLDRLFGSARTIAEELRREAADQGIAVRVGVAATRAAARLLAYGRPGITLIDAGEEAQGVASLPLDVLARMVLADVPVRPNAPRSARFYRASPMQELARAQQRGRKRGSASDTQIDRYADILVTLTRWGLKTLGDLAALAPADLSERLGQDGMVLQRLARGEDADLLVPYVADERFEGHLDLEWPIEEVEPLSFVLGRLLDAICVHLERRGRAAAAISVELRLVTRDTHVRRLQLPAPIRDPRVLRTLALLDLESNPPSAAIDAVDVRIEPTPGRVLQYSLLERAQPAPEQMSTLLARLGALMGQDRCGSPVLLDTHRPGAFTMAPFAADQGSRSRQVEPPPVSQTPSPALRRYRRPIPIRVTVDGYRPTRVASDRVGLASGRVEMSAGPWRTSGEWWADGWRRDEWDVALDDGTVCRIYRDHGTSAWFMDAVVD
jgi:protein ImuB